MLTDAFVNKPDSLFHFVLHGNHDCTILETDTGESVGLSGNLRFAENLRKQSYKLG